MGKISFWKLLNDNKTVIPIIQRDYAQGRIGKEHIREKFLTQILGALRGDKSGELDFVYGTTTKDRNFYPLDGQQRLTTLWLLHWFIASKAGKLNDAKEILKKFSYETRTSSREFCEKLCDFDLKDANQGEDANEISKTIQNQTWFYSSWKQDPTIQSMLRMLQGSDVKDKKGSDFIDGIAECFGSDFDFANLWEKLIGDSCPIKFSKLEIGSDELPVSDDLYIKMNARSKPLTDFESFKADLISSLSEPAQVIYGDLIDNKWTDHFWNDKQTDIFDKKWMAFLCRFTVCVLIENLTDTNTDEKIKETLKNRRVYENDTGTSFSYEYKAFGDFEGIFNAASLERLKKIFDGWKKLKEEWKSDSQKDQQSDILASAWNDNFYFIPVQKDENEKTVSTLTMKTRVLFYGTMLFCEKVGENNGLISKWEDWKRVMWNLAENTNDSVGVMRMLKKLGERCLDIYMYLIDSSNELDFASEQLKEEIEKAKQIIKARNDRENGQEISPNEEEIVKAEKFAFFKGAIRFLYTDGEGNVKWDDFETKFKNAEKYFDEEGLKADKWPDANKIVISFCDNWDKQLTGKHLFGKGKERWNKILLGKEYRNSVHMLLSENPEVNKKVSTQDGNWVEVVEILRDNKEIWNEINDNFQELYFLNTDYWWNPRLRVRYYPAKTIWIIDNGLRKLCEVIKRYDPNNEIAEYKFFMNNKDYRFSIEGKNYIFKAYRGWNIECEGKEMNFDEFLESVK